MFQANGQINILLEDMCSSILGPKYDWSLYLKHLIFLNYKFQLVWSFWRKKFFILFEVYLQGLIPSLFSNGQIFSLNKSFICVSVRLRYENGIDRGISVVADVAEAFGGDNRYANIHNSGQKTLTMINL